MDLNTKLADTSIDNVCLTNALKRANITTVGELLFYSFKDLRAINSIGKKRLSIIKKWAKENNLKFDHELTDAELEKRNEERRKNININSNVWDIFDTPLSTYLEKLGIYTIDDLLSIEDLSKFVKNAKDRLHNEWNMSYTMISEKHITQQVQRNGLQFYNKINLPESKQPAYKKKTKKNATFKNIHIKNNILDVISEARNEERLYTEEILHFFFNCFKKIFDDRKQCSNEIYFSMLYTNPDGSFVKYPKDNDHSLFLSKVEFSYFTLVNEANEIETLFMDKLFENKKWQETLFSLDDLIDLLTEIDVYYELPNIGIIKIYPQRKLSLNNPKQKIMM